MKFPWSKTKTDNIDRSLEAAKASVEETRNKRLEAAREIEKAFNKLLEMKGTENGHT